MKIILTVFGIIALLFVIQAAVGYVSTEKKRENFENNDEHEKDDHDPKKHSDDKDKKDGPSKKSTKDDDKKESSKKHVDDDEDEKPKSKDLKESKERSKHDKEEKREGWKEEGKKEVEPIDKAKEEVKKLKLSILESVENIFEKHYPGSQQKPVVFDKLLTKETFEEIKDQKESGKPVNDIVQDMIYNHMKTIEKMEQGAGFNIKEYYATPPVHTNPFDMNAFMKGMGVGNMPGLMPQSSTESTPPQTESSANKEKFENNSMEDLKKQIKDLVQKVDSMQKQAEDAKKKMNPEQESNSAKTKVIEGFENRYNYAAF